MKHLKKLLLSIEKRKDGHFYIFDECDGVELSFTAAELRELAQEILDVANGAAARG